MNGAHLCIPDVFHGREIEWVTQSIEGREEERAGERKRVREGRGGEGMGKGDDEWSRTGGRGHRDASEEG